MAESGSSPTALLMSVFLVGALVGACNSEPTIEEEPEEAVDRADALTSQENNGLDLFFHATFGGNGRTCSTCHRLPDYTLTPAAAQAVYASNPNDPLFRAIDSDDGTGASYTNLLQEGVIRITLPLPPNVRPLDDPNATTVTVLRGVPTVMNTAALDPVLMWDGRAPDLEAQALGAVHDHTENTVEPSASQLSDIAAFEETLFTSEEIRQYAEEGKPVPALPGGNAFKGKSLFNNFCGFCHGGPLLNENTSFGKGRFLAVLNGTEREGFAGTGKTAQTFIKPLMPVREWVFTNPDGTQEIVKSPDLGRALITGNASDANKFKVSPLRGISRTAPYFHDNRAKTLKEAVQLYQQWFQLISGNGKEHTLSNQDVNDIVAFLNLL